MSGILTRALARLLLLPILVTAVAFLVKGYSSTGDGFSAGVIASLGILLQFISCGHRKVMQRLRLRYVPEATMVGVLIAFLVVFVPVLLGEPPVTHFPQPDEEVIYLGTLELHTAVLFDLGVFLVIFGFAIAAIHIIAAEAESPTRKES